MQRPRQPKTLRPAFALAATLLGACSDGGGLGDEQPPTPMPPTLVDHYSGDFPCSNCATIEAALWLRADGRFFLRQRYVDADGASDAPSCT